MTENNPATTAPSATPHPAQARRGWPWWAWALLFGVPFLVLSGLVAIVFTGLLLGQASQGLNCYVYGDCEPARGAAPIPGASDSSDDRTEAAKKVPLEGSAVFEGQPVWSFTLEPTWQALPFDQDGIDVFQDEATGCQLITSQGVAVSEAESASDAELSYALLSREIKGFTADNPDALILNAGAPIDIAIASAASESTIEFASATIDQKSADGVSQTIEIAARSMPGSEGELLAVLTCDTAALSALGTKFELFSTALAVTVSP
ncbi:hypothetical protein [uncultured Salinibacterium sp.]|uniref:hypothetical protein n=1 Tax=uncultured Salinibacterium sp. TaxID=459274 RepID=UPI0030D8BFD5|tara:strand:+ start:84823 stop:85611 length:789 start_codon:yes stop_codon:yes gene_type:complete